MYASQDKYNLSEIWALELPNILVYAIPAFFVLIGLELALSWYNKKESYKGKDFLASAGLGIGNLISTAGTKVFIFTAIWAIYYYVSPFNIPNEWWAYPLCLVALDFCRYWSHRITHEQRFWWATHVPHHSSEQYNFAVSFRLSWVQQIKIIFFVPVALMGFNPIVFFICHQVEVLYQFWLHTEYIKKMPRWFEYVFVTPSHHRVHHARNPKYLDRNYGSTLVLWDRIFGTFQPEEETPEYGITKPPNSFNPVYLVFHEFIDLVRDMRKAKSVKLAWRILFSPPGTEVDVEKQALILPMHLGMRDKINVHFDEGDDSDDHPMDGPSNGNASGNDQSMNRQDTPTRKDLVSAG